MFLDQTTLLLVLTASSLVLAACLIAVDPSSRGDDGLQAWGAGLLVHAASHVAYLLRWWDWLMASVLLSNGLTALALALHVHALTRFVPGLPRRWRHLIVWGPPVLTQIVVVLLLERHDARIVLCSALLAGQTAAAIALAWHAGRVSALRGAWLVVTGMALLGAMMLARIAMFLLQGGWQPPLGPPAPVQAATYLVSLMVVLLNTTGYLLMHKERVAALLHELATHDPLTGATNRRALHDVLQRNVALAARTHLPLSLLMIDIDHFKRVNDGHGHPVGDRVLRTVAARIQERLRAQDLLARYGGEEFLVVLPLTSCEGARRVAEDIRAAVAQPPVVVDALELPVTVSVGVATRSRWPEGDTPGRRGPPTDAGLPLPMPGLLLPPEHVDRLAQALVDTCDAAMYEAKRQGRARVVVHEEARGPWPVTSGGEAGTPVRPAPDASVRELPHAAPG
jgi:diguanylate cyclase (GGDEF)-like protein